MNKYDFIHTFLEKCEDSQRLRQLRSLEGISAARIVHNGRQLLNFSSNDYLALNNDEQLKKAAIAAIEQFGVGSTASRLVCGTHELHTQLEEKLAQWKKTEAALLFNNGFQANCGIIQAIADRHTLVFSDKLNHASIVDGTRLSGAKQVRFKHGDMQDLELLLEKHKDDNCRKIIISETLFSMDGDYCDFKALAAFAKKYNTLLYLDDAHGSAINGPQGRGPAHEIMTDVDFYVGTFGKALGSFGAYCACSSEIKNYLINAARSFIFSTSLPPAVIAANIAAVERVQEMNEEREKVVQLSKDLRQRLSDAGFATNDDSSPIVPLIVGSEKDTLELCAHLLENSIFAIAIRPPTVAAGSCRIRLTLTAAHTEEDINKLMKVLKKR